MRQLVHRGDDILFRLGHAAWGSYAALALSALAVGLVMGPLIERGLLKWMYGKDEIVLLLVRALFLVLEDAIKLVWGVDQMFSDPMRCRQLPAQRAGVSDLQPGSDRGAV
jgi:branched-subunit amino acid ABC-type transport system permease component